MKKILLFTVFSAIFLLSAQLLRAQEDTKSDSVTWKKSGSFNFGITGTGFSNWAAGGSNTLSFTGLSDGKISRNTQKSLWEARWLLSYGLARIGDGKQLFKKNDDQIILGSDYSLKTGKDFSLTAFGEFRSQFSNSYQYKINPTTGQEEQTAVLSRMFAPAYLLTAVGAKYTSKNFSMSLLPLTGKFTFVLDDSLASKWSFGQTPGEKIRSEIGTAYNFNLAVSPLENVLFKSNLNLFSAYPKYLKEIDVNWEGMLVFKVNKYLNISVLGQLIYDQDIVILKADGRKTRDIQFKHVFTFNIGYKFASELKKAR